MEILENLDYGSTAIGEQQLRHQGSIWHFKNWPFGPHNS